MWESRSAISKAVGNDGKPAFGFPRFPWPVISTALCCSYFMRFYSDRSWQTAFVFPAAFSALQPCRWSAPLSGSNLLPSAPASSTAPDPAPAAESPTVSHTIDILFSACLWLRLVFPELHKADESSSRG